LLAAINIIININQLHIQLSHSHTLTHTLSHIHKRQDAESIPGHAAQSRRLISTHIKYLSTNISAPNSNWGCVSR